MKIGEPTLRPGVHPLWGLAFRAGFLFAASFAVAAMLRWLAWIELPGHWSASVSPHWWHGHEMIFGFVLPVVSGFLLTAVATWTGTRGTTGRRLQVLFGLWLLARLLLWLAPAPWWPACAAELLFILFTLYELLLRVWPARQWRNLLFAPVLLALAAVCVASYRLAEDPLSATRLHYAALWLITVLVTIIGGRVIPLFTGNRLGESIPPPGPVLEYSAIGSVSLVAVLAIFWPEPAAPWLRLLYLLTAVLQLYRMAHWRGWKTVSIPLLWSMHLAYLFIPMTLLALAAAGGDPVAVRNSIHLLAIGTVGGMILSMMSRVALGHTGRPLQLPAGLAAAFAAVFLAALLRALLPTVAVAAAHWAWRLSALLWIIAFSLYLVRYLPVLCRARVDGKPG